MLDPLSALSVAGNVIQFVDFTSKLFGLTSEVYRSASGASKETEELEAIAKHLQGLCARLSQSAQSLSPQHPPDAELKELAGNCSSVGAELLKALASLKSNGTNKGWQSFRLALATTWKAKKIEALCQRLQSFRSQLILHLIAQQDAIQRNRDSSILASLATFEAQSRQLGADMEINISSMKDEIVATLELLGDEFQRQLKEGTRENLTSVQNPASITTLSNKLSNFATRGNDTSTSFRFLKSLRFRAMEVRHSSITEAHEKTLEWLFSKKYNFIQWLQSTGQIFWISGKPGSGKSTLLKFLVDNARMKTALKAWAGANTLVTASFFFWIAGTDMQKSQEGLLRSLLFQILKKHPQLMPATFPAQWQSLRSSHTDSELVIWSRKELLDGFERLKNNQFSSARFFFVIDGLDEYEGDHTDLLDVLDGLMSSMNVKICLSSRPWNVFEAAFGDQQMQKLYMEDFNRADIQLYVQDRLERRSEFQNFAQDHAWAKKVVEEIVEKSKGVFLWVYLVVRSLVQGLINHDRVMDLQKRLLDFPSDLDAFFRQIFTSLDPVYRIQTARTFQVALANRGPLSLLNYWFLDCEEEDPQFSLAMTPVALPQTDVRKREDIMRKRLNARCKGLVQFETRNKVKSFAADSTPLERGQSEFEVEFLHRTVKDFLMTEDMQKMIANWLDSSFNPNLTICRTLLAELKSVSPYYFSVAEDVVPISSP